MISVVISSVTPFCGKNAVAVGIAGQLKAAGKKVGYFKPIGPLVKREGETLTDEDVVFFRNALELEDPLGAICPIVLSEETISQTLRGEMDDSKKKVMGAFKTVSKGKDIVFTLSMGDLSSGLSLGFPMLDFVRETKARVLTVDRFRWPIGSLDGLLNMKNLLGDHLAGVVFNKVRNGHISRIEQGVVPYLASHGIESFGYIPDDPELAAVPVGDLVEGLGAEVLCCGDKMDELVEEISVGAMNAEAALRFFRKCRNQAVITGGDRPDIHLAALEASTRCLILTGSLYPNERILTRAEEAGVPVLLTEYPTSRAAQICDRIQHGLSLHCMRKVPRVQQLAKDHLDWARLHAALGL